jgi:hypothetical protein
LLHIFFSDGIDHFTDGNGHQPTFAASGAPLHHAINGVRSTAARASPEADQSEGRECLQFFFERFKEQLFQEVPRSAQLERGDLSGP